MARDVSRDVEFESLLRRALGAEVASLPLVVEPADVLRRRHLLRRRQARRRVGLLLVAALIVLPLGALIVGILRPDPEPGYSAVLVRTTDGRMVQMLLADDGAARGVVDVPETDLEKIEYLRVLEADPSGWVALTGAESVLLFDVREARPTIIRDGPGHGAWTTDGRYWSATNDDYELIDPVSGEVITLTRSVTEDFDWWTSDWGRMMVEADGPGLLVADWTDDGGPGRVFPRRWAVLGPDGTITEGLPKLAEGMGSRLLSERWGLLHRCDPWALTDCPGDGTSPIVSGPAGDGTFRQWGGTVAVHDHIIGASWAIDGGLWLIVDRRSGGRTIVLIHRDEAGTDREVAAFDVSLGKNVAIADLAPDDSLIGLEMTGEWPRVQTVIVDTSTGRSHRFEGGLGGFVPIASTIEWPRTDAPTQAGKLLTSAPTGDATVDYAALPDVQEHLEQQIVGEVLLVHEVEATATDPGTTASVTLGPVELEEGIGVSVMCSGPGTISVTVIGPDGPDFSDIGGCLEGGTHPEAPSVLWESATIEVEYDVSTSWRLVVYDPPTWVPPPTNWPP